jgi:hypothetical protein
MGHRDYSMHIGCFFLNIVIMCWAVLIHSHAAHSTRWCPSVIFCFQANHAATTPTGAIAAAAAATALPSPPGQRRSAEISNSSNIGDDSYRGPVKDPHVASAWDFSFMANRLAMEGSAHGNPHAARYGAGVWSRVWPRGWPRVWPRGMA